MRRLMTPDDLEDYLSSTGQKMIGQKPVTRNINQEAGPQYFCGARPAGKNVNRSRLSGSHILQSSGTQHGSVHVENPVVQCLPASSPAKSAGAAWHAG